MTATPKAHTSVPTPAEARDILGRYNRSHFNLPGERARYSIPVRHDHDDDVMLAAFIDAAEADKARLDWMQEHAMEEGRTMAMPRYAFRIAQWKGMPGPNIRGAIDEEMKDEGLEHVGKAP